jgi:hypothetical protein
MERFLMAIKPISPNCVKSPVAEAVASLEASDMDLWCRPVQGDDQAKALKVLKFSWTHLKPIVFPVFPKEPSRPEIIAAALETQARVLMVLRLLSANHI